MLDPALLRHLDFDGDGRLLSHELRQAISWTLATFSDRRGIESGLQSLSARQIAPGGPDGERLARSIDLILERIGKGGGDLALDELRDYAARLAEQPVSSAGILLPDAAGSEELRSFIIDAIRVTGGTPHPSGATGLRVDQGAEFTAGIDPYLQWMSSKPAAFGEHSDEIALLIDELARKIDQFFLLGSLSRMDPRLSESIYGIDPFHHSADADSAFDLSDSEKLDELLDRYPIASPRVDGRLEQVSVDNAKYADSIARLFSLAVGPRWPDSPGVMTEAMWKELARLNATYSEWIASRPRLTYDAIDPARLSEYRAGTEASEISELAAAAEAEEIGPEAVALVEKALLFQAHILRVAKNFVSFAELYTSDTRAVFETGSLVIDGRYFHLAVRVVDRAKHKQMAVTSNMFVLYAVVRDTHGASLYEVAVPVTSGSIGNLGIGKRGVFLDTECTELDAEIVDTIENPVSLIEAIRAPFNRLGNSLTTRIENLGATTEKQVASGKAGGLFGSGNTAGLLAGGGVAVAAIGSAAAFITGTLARIAWWKILLALGALAAAIALPAIVAAALKLRRRDISVILNASGWAINSRMRLTRSLSRFFTQQPGTHYRPPDIIRKSFAASAEGRPARGYAGDPRAAYPAD